MTEPTAWEGMPQQLSEEQIAANVQAGLLDENPPQPESQPDAQPQPEGQAKPDTQPQQTQPAAQPQAQPEPKLQFQGAWDKLKEQGVEVSEDYLKGNFGEGVDEYTALQQTILESNKPQGPQATGDPFIDGYMQTDPEKRSEYVRNYNQAEQLMQMDADAGLKWLYQQQKKADGERRFTDEQIEEELSNRTVISKETEWDRAKEFIEKNRRQAMQAPQPTPEERATNIKQTNDAILDRVKPLLAEEDSMTEYQGIPYTPEMKAEFKETFARMTTINPETGNPHIVEFLNDDKNLRDMVRAYNATHGDKLKAYLSNFKEDFKEDVFNKLDLNPKPQSGSPPFEVAQNPDDFV